jgi:trk system potassium uptake protein TrkA
MKEKAKSYAVIGLGFFGMSLARTLAEADCDVLAIDDQEENIQEIAELVTYAVKADVKEPGVLKSLGVKDVDVVIVTISENMEASILATIQAKDLGVPYVMAKAQSELHGRILRKIGADEVLYPEQSMGVRVAHNLLTNGFSDLFELSTEFSLAEFRIPKAWAGKTLAQLHIREKHKINVIGIKRGEKVEINPDPGAMLPADCTLIAVGKNRDLNAVPTE